MVTRSSYGRREVTNMTGDLAKARNFVVMGVDPAVKADVTRMFEEAKRMWEDLDGQKDEYDAKAKECNKVEEGLNVFIFRS